MLSYEVMGAVGLAIVWVNALLMAAAAVRDGGPARAVGRRLRRAAAGHGDDRLVVGRVVRGLGGAADGGAGLALALHRTEQVGRAIDTASGLGVQFSDRAYRSEVFGGEVAVDGGAAPIVVAPTSLGAGWVWASADARRRAGHCPSAAALAATARAARGAKGASRTVDVAVGAGDTVWVLGAFEGGAVTGTVAAPVLVATFDPRRWCAGRRALVLAFVLGELAVLAALTAVACSAPPFGAASTAGAAGCLAFFLLVQPLGSWVLKSALLLPHESRLFDAWAPPRPTLAGSTSA